MVKVKENFTLDQDISDKINKEQNKSEKANQIFREYYDNHKDPALELDLLNRKRIEIDIESSKFILQLQKIAEDGNKKERVDALKRIKEEEERLKGEDNRALKTLDIAKRSQIWKDYLSGNYSKDIKDLIPLVIRIREEENIFVDAKGLQLVIEYLERNNLLKHKGAILQ